jgi:hypothetical protein
MQHIRFLHSTQDMRWREIGVRKEGIRIAYAPPRSDDQFRTIIDLEWTTSPRIAPR